MTIDQLRQQHPRFIYHSYQAKIGPTGLVILFHFQIEPKIEFHPTVTIEGVTSKQWKAIPQQLRDEWVFHLGLAEIPSYWKATASPQIVIKAGHLNADQIAWWHDLLIKGMGEYFYVNDIDFTVQNFVSWSTGVDLLRNFSSKSLNPELQLKENISSQRQHAPYLIPLGGGKDSALTASLFNQHNLEFDVFLLNPTPAMQQIAQLTHPQRTIIAHRAIDPQLLQLNQQGYLNGHVPFSAYLAFLSRLTGVIFGHRRVIIANERSSNEGNTEYRGQKINHQYSKTWAFEQKFTHYLTDHHLLPPQTQPGYFSLLRPLYELQISQRLAHSPDFAQLAPVFRSCNRGQKTNSWCGECPKCLFTFASLYPFIDQGKLISIFGQNLFENNSLLDEALALLGKTKTKPFECVGTHEESKAAFYLCIKKIQTTDHPLPALLQLIWDQVLSSEQNLQQRAQTILKSWNHQHQVPTILTALLRKVIIFGLGQEGLSTYHYLRSQLPDKKIILVDEKPLAELESAWAKIIKSDQNVEFTSQPPALISALLFKTPGIPASHPIVKQVLKTNGKLSSNTQLFFELIQNQPKITVIGVTGTKGKSTTASMIQHLLSTNNINSALGGNVGKPVLELWQQNQDKTHFVLELSSHQLAELNHSPHIAVIQDITREHLDYYADFEQYLQAKTQIARFQHSTDQVIFNADSSTATKMAQLGSGTKLGFSLQDQELVTLAKNSPLLGKHNLYNVIPAIIIGRQLGLSDQQLIKALKTFEPLPHRLELVAEIKGVKYYDDSIATTPQATMAALEAFTDQPIILLAGGYERHQDYAQLAQKIKDSQVRAIALFPTTGARLLAELQKLDLEPALLANIQEFNSMSSAVKFAATQAKAGDVVLLSPAAASFGLFKDYRDRGNQFKAAINQLM